MKYELRVSGGSKEIVATAEQADHFAAEAWARDWVKSKAAQDSYRLEAVEGDFCRLLFKTEAGQWYLTPAQRDPVPA